VQDYLPKSHPSRLIVAALLLTSARSRIFRKRHLKALPSLFVLVLKLAEKAGLEARARRA
jgi:hypothetical protein